MDSSSKLDCPATVNVRTVKPDFMAVTWLVSAMSHAEIEMHVNSVVFAGGKVCQKKVSRSGSHADRRTRCSL